MYLFIYQQPRCKHIVDPLLMEADGFPQPMCYMHPADILGTSHLTDLTQMKQTAALHWYQFSELTLGEKLCKHPKMSQHITKLKIYFCL